MVRQRQQFALGAPLRQKPYGLRDRHGKFSRPATPGPPLPSTAARLICRTSSSATSTPTPRIDDMNNVLALDLGTSTYSVTFCRTELGSIVQPSQVHRVRLSSDSNRSCLGQMVAAFHDGEWYIGNRLEKNRDKIPQDKIITNYKLLTYDPYADEPQVRMIRDQLQQAGQSEDQLMIATLRYIWTDVQSYLFRALRRYNVRYDPERTWVYISVPIMATLKTNKWLADLAHTAGLPRISFVYEPLCAAACIIEEVRNKLIWPETASRYNGATALVLDCGGGTSDAVLVRLSKDFAANGVNRVDVVGQPEGDLCGSSTVDENFWIWIQAHWNSRPGGTKEVLRKLGASSAKIRAHAIRLFTPYKEKFPGLYNEDPIYIRGTTTHLEQFKLDTDIIKQLFESPVRRIIALAHRAIQRDTKLILLCGGLGASIYLHERLEAEFLPLDIEVERPEATWAECPVAAGAPRVRGLMNQSQTRARYAVGLNFTSEPFNRRIHKDGLRNKRQLDLDVVKKDEVLSKKYKKEVSVVEDRIKWMVTQNTPGTVEGEFISSPESSEQTLQMFLVNLEVARPQWSYTLVFTTRTDVEDHQALKHPDGRLHDGLITETRVVRLQRDLIERYKQHGWECFLSPGFDEITGKPLPECSHLQIYCKFAMRHDNKTISVGYQLIAPQYKNYISNGKLRKNVNTGGFDQAEWIEVWDADFAADVLDGSTSESAEDRAQPAPGPSSRPIPSTEHGDTQDDMQPNNRPPVNGAHPIRSQSATMGPRSPIEISSGSVAGASRPFVPAKRKKGKEREVPANSKRPRKRPAPMSQAQVNGRSNSETAQGESSQLCEYEYPH